MKRLVFSLLLTALFYTTFSQNTFCGTYISPEWMQAFYNRDKSHLEKKSGALEQVIIPITYHIVGDNSGNGYYSLAELFRSHCELQELYNNANVTFYIKEIDYINNTSYYNGNNSYGLFQQNDATSCNVYVINTMDACGYSFVPQNWDGSGWDGPNGGGIMLQKGCMQAGNTTYRHEMGHYLNLPHTFYGWEGEAPPSIGQNAPNTIGGVPVERANGSNCAASGDGFCDTPADYLSDRWTCQFDRHYNDPTGQQITVDEKNFMSYSYDGCASYLKPDQLAEVNASPAIHRPYLLIDPVPTFYSMNVISDIFPGNLSNVNPTSVTISWEQIPNADYYHLQFTEYNFINPTIDTVVSDTFITINGLITDRDYKYKVKPVSLVNVCTDFSEINTITTAKFRVNTNIDSLLCVDDSDGSITINPIDNGSYSYQWFEWSNNTYINYPNGNTNTLFNLNSGEYAVLIIKNNIDSLWMPFSIGAANPLLVEVFQSNDSLIANISGGAAPYYTAWNTGEQTTYLVNPEDGTYEILVVDQFGCQKTISGVFDKSISAINTIATIASIEIFPNPLQQNQLTIAFNAQSQTALNIEIYNFTGQLLYNSFKELKLGANELKIETENWANGVYFVRLADGKSFISKRLVIAR